VPSRPGEFHPEPLTEPDLTLSRHPARATATKAAAFHWTSSSSRCRLTRANSDDPLPSLHGRYPASVLLRSSPPLIGASVLSASRLEPLVLSLRITG